MRVLTTFNGKAAAGTNRGDRNFISLTTTLPSWKESSRENLHRFPV